MAKIQLIADVPGWAFDVQCQGIKKFLSDEYDIEIKYFRDEIKDNFDLTYYASYILARGQTPKEKSCCCLVGFHTRTPEKAVEMMSRTLCANYTARYLYEGVIHLVPKGFRLFYIPYGIDTEIFRPFNEKKQDSVLKVGWVGNPNRPYKRYKLIEKVMKQIKGVNFMPIIGKQMENEELVEYYNKIDLYVNFSYEEGFCYPILEASACGVGVVASRVGVSEEIGADIIDNIEQMKNRIEYYRDHREELSILGNICRTNAVEKFDWRILKKDYKKMFDYVLKKGKIEK